MKAVRWLLVIACCLAADLSSPVTPMPREAFEGEADKSLSGTSFRRAARLIPARYGRPSIERRAPVRRPSTILARTETPDRAVRKVPASASDTPSESEDA